MHYFIDGYNLMFRFSLMQNSLQAEREHFVAELYKKIQVVGLDATIVFDAQYQEGLGSRSHFNSLEICFTDEGETADDYIIRELASTPNPREEMVVTSDNQLAWRARRMHAKTEQVAEFMRWLEHRYRKKKKDLPEKLEPIEIPAIVLPDPSPSLFPEMENSEDNYYLEAFEKKFKETNPPISPPKVKDTPTNDAYESESERWQRLFENRADDQDPCL